MKKNKTKLVDAHQLAFDFDWIEVMTEEESVRVDPLPITEEVIKEWEFEWADKDNVHLQYPFLRWHQAEDISRCEKRFFIDGGKGVQVTNSTGVGKTFLGLGLANRFFYKGKQNILIVVPTDKKAKDWIKDNARFFDTKVRQVENTTTLPLMGNSQPGIVITTYSNFYQNDNLDQYVWDLIIYDESHRLMENGQKKDTVYLERHRKIASLPSTWRNENIYKDFHCEETGATYKISDQDKFDEIAALPIEKRQTLLKEYTDRTKVLFLSASPFAYHFNTIIGDGCLWNIKENYSLETNEDIWNSEYTGYNIPGRYEKFFIENFGYKMRTNKLTIPDTGVDIALMERMFFEKYNKAGIIFGRQIEVDKDYSREFVLLNSEIGQKIDEGLSVFEDREFKKEYKYLPQIIESKVNYLYKNQLLESIKSSLIIPRVEMHLNLGRKVVLFHDFNNSNVGHPFRFNSDDFFTAYPEDMHHYINEYLREVDKFDKEYKHLIELEIDESLSNPRQEILKAFGKQRTAVFSGKISKTERSRMKDAFQDDLSGIDIIVIQRQAGKEGIDLHDITGNYQRVLIDLGLPRRPTDAIQVEGRTYRDGVKSDAIWEYPIINTIFESNTFSSIISQRASTAENLAMGNKARNLKSAFKQGYIDYTTDEPNNEQGKGGKEKDFSYNTMSDFDLATALYYTNQKKNSKNKAQEGVDYFATPEPLGYKMVEWLHAQSDDRLLEPSAGHGAIARFFKGHTNNYVIEPSRELMSKLKLNCDEVKQDSFIYDMFENYDRSNKFHGIVMNPPFGTGGKLACEHLDKALFQHTYHYGDVRNRRSRVIAILPCSSYVNKYIEDVFNEQKTKEKYKAYELSTRLSVIKNFKLSAEILLPSVTFNRAGTSVVCKIVIFDAINIYNENRTKIELDLSHITKIEDFFNEIENIHIPTFVPSTE